MPGAVVEQQQQQRPRRSSRLSRLLSALLLTTRRAPPDDCSISSSSSGEDEEEDVLEGKKEKEEQEEEPSLQEFGDPQLDALWRGDAQALALNVKDRLSLQQAVDAALPCLRRAGGRHLRFLRIGGAGNAFLSPAHLLKLAQALEASRHEQHQHQHQHQQVRKWREHKDTKEAATSLVEREERRRKRRERRRQEREATKSTTTVTTKEDTKMQVLSQHDGDFDFDGVALEGRYGIVGKAEGGASSPHCEKEEEGFQLC